jgi:hypothetical protein
MKTQTVGVRLTPVLEQRLEELCAMAQRRPSVVLGPTGGKLRQDAIGRSLMAS